MKHFSLIVIILLMFTTELFCHDQSIYHWLGNNSINITTPVRYNITDKQINYGIDCNFIYMLVNSGITYNPKLSKDDLIMEGVNINFGLGVKLIQIKYFYNLDQSYGGLKIVSEWVLFNGDSPYETRFSDKWWKPKDGMILSLSFNWIDYKFKEYFVVGVGFGLYFSIVNP